MGLAMADLGFGDPRFRMEVQEKGWSLGRWEWNPSQGRIINFPLCWDE